MPGTLRARFLNIANYITMGRIVAVFLLLVLMLFVEDGGPIFSYIAAGFFLLVMISDMVDGYYARKCNITSTFGQFFDPLADKLLFLVAMILMIPLGRIPAWMVSLFLIREVIVTALRSIAIDEGVVIAASEWGKYKSAFVTGATTAFLIHYRLWGIEWRMIGWVLIWPALIFSMISGVHYIFGFVRELKKQKSG